MPAAPLFAGDRVYGTLRITGTRTPTNSSGKTCDYVIEGSGFTVQDAEQDLAVSE